MNLFRTPLLSLALSAFALSASAQALVTGDTLVIDSSRSVAKVDVGVFSPEINMTWNSVERRELRTERNGQLLQLMSDTGYIAIDKKSFAYMIGQGASILQPHTVNSNYSGTVSDGAKWETRTQTTGMPVSWCASTLETEVKSKYTVGKPEMYKVVVDGKPVETQVFPIYENGWWNRCVSGKVVRKFLYSPELEAPVSIEVAMYSSNGRDVNNSHMVRVVEIRRASQAQKVASQ
jgi:hypothetical protein